MVWMPNEAGEGDHADDYYNYDDDDYYGGHVPLFIDVPCLTMSRSRVRGRLSKGRRGQRHKQPRRAQASHKPPTLPRPPGFRLDPFLTREKLSKCTLAAARLDRAPVPEPRQAPALLLLHALLPDYQAAQGHPQAGLGGGATRGGGHA